MAAGLVLAAGGGRRYGGPKALVRYEGSLLVERAVRTVRDAGCAPIVVVLGRRRGRGARDGPAGRRRPGRERGLEVGHGLVAAGRAGGARRYRRRGRRGAAGGHPRRHRRGGPAGRRRRRPGQPGHRDLRRAARAPGGARAATTGPAWRSSPPATWERGPTCRPGWRSCIWCRARTSPTTPTWTSPSRPRPDRPRRPRLSRWPGRSRRKPRQTRRS